MLLLTMTLTLTLTLTRAEIYTLTPTPTPTPILAVMRTQILTLIALLPQLRSWAERAISDIQAMTEAGAARASPEELRMALPGVGCWSPKCRNMAGPAEDALATLTCSACGVAQYCSSACQKAHWKAHKPACRIAQG